MAERNREELARRLKIVEDCIETGAGLTAAAKIIGISAPGLSQYLDAAGHQHIRRELGGATRIATSLPMTTHIERLQAIVEEGSQAAACRRLGVKPPAMSKWLKDNGYGPNYDLDLEDLLDDGSNG